MRLLLLIPLGHNVRSWSNGSGSRVHVHAYYVLHCGASPSWLLPQQIRRKQQRSPKAQPRETDAPQRRRTQKEERERGASNPNKRLGQLGPGRMTIFGPCPGPPGCHIICLVFFSRVGRLFDFWKNRDPGCFQTTYQKFKNLRFSEFFLFFIFIFSMDDLW
jgi:hypothetical protein